MKPHEEWLFKAEHDIASSNYLLTAPQPLFDIAVYHTHQCAEKSLKAYLAFKEEGDLMPTLETAKKAIATSQAILNFAKAKINMNA